MDKQQDIRPGYYRHYKGGLYRVLGCARHTESLEHVVVYRALYGEGGLWVRPYSMFDETVIVDSHQQPRFEYLGETLPEEA
ncbi:MAG: DUF1653 domain-containing protein [Pseudomonadales bacterium]|nr:DUF1653 domain-containing protein [Pseudomonadales bacterium]